MKNYAKANKMYMLKFAWLWIWALEEFTKFMLNWPEPESEERLEGTEYGR